jgi:hypothetical protein
MVSMERDIDMTGPMLEYSATATGEARLTVDMCVNPATLSGSGRMIYDGDGHRSDARLSDEAVGTVTIDGWAACLPGAEVNAFWNEVWDLTEVASWPGGSRVFQLHWTDVFPLSFPFETGISRHETAQVPVQPQNPGLDVTTSTTAFEVNFCVRLCDPARLAAELEDHLRLAHGWQRALFETDLTPRTGESLPEFRHRLEAWIDDTPPGAGFPTGLGASSPQGIEGDAGGPSDAQTPVDGGEDGGAAPFPRGDADRVDAVADNGAALHPRSETDAGGTDTLTQRPSTGQAATGSTPIPREGGEAGSQDLSSRPDRADAPMSGAEAPETRADGAAQGAGPISLVRRLRVDPASCAIEQLQDPGRWGPAAFPLSQDCTLQSVATRRVLTERARCLAVRQCSLDAEDPIAGPGRACLAPAAYETALRADISILAIHQVEAQCDSARRLLWWLEQHAACNRLPGGLGDIRRAVADVCDPVSDIGTGTDGESAEWSPESSFCREDCEARYSRPEAIEICMIECRAEELRNARQRASEMFSDFDESAEDLLRTAIEIMREIARQQEQATGRMTR